MKHSLTPFEETIYNTLKAKLGVVVSRSEIYCALYDHADSIAPMSNSMEVLIRRLRSKLLPGTTIKAKRGCGYVMEVKALCDRCTTNPATQSVLIEGHIPAVVCSICLSLNRNIKAA